MQLTKPKARVAPPPSTKTNRKTNVNLNFGGSKILLGGATLDLGLVNWMCQSAEIGAPIFEESGIQSFANARCDPRNGGDWASGRKRSGPVAQGGSAEITRLRRHDCRVRILSFAYAPRHVHFAVCVSGLTLRCLRIVSWDLALALRRLRFNAGASPFAFPSPFVHCCLHLDNNI